MDVFQSGLLLRNEAVQCGPWGRKTKWTTLRGVVILLFFPNPTSISLAGPGLSVLTLDLPVVNQ